MKQKNLLFPELGRRHTGKFAEHHDKVTGIGITYIKSNLLNLAIPVGEQQFFGTGDPVTGQIFVQTDATDIAATHKLPGITSRPSDHPYNVPQSVLEPDAHIFPTEDHSYLNSQIPLKNEEEVNNSRRITDADY